jgi:hypothetical protein
MLYTWSAKFPALSSTSNLSLRQLLHPSIAMASSPNIALAIQGSAGLFSSHNDSVTFVLALNSHSNNFDAHRPSQHWSTASSNAFARNSPPRNASSKNAAPPCSPYARRILPKRPNWFSDSFAPSTRFGLPRKARALAAAMTRKATRISMRKALSPRPRPWLQQIHRRPLPLRPVPPLCLTIPPPLR